MPPLKYLEYAVQSMQGLLAKIGCRVATECDSLVSMNSSLKLIVLRGETKPFQG